MALARHPQRWKPPVAGMVKINVDRGLSRDGATAASAAVCRDNEGQFLGSSSMVFPGVTDPAYLEALACREAQALALDLNLGKVIISCDSKGVVDDIKNDARGMNDTSIREIRENKLLF